MDQLQREPKLTALEEGNRMLNERSPSMNQSPFTTLHEGPATEHPESMLSRGYPAKAQLVLVAIAGFAACAAPRAKQETSTPPRATGADKAVYALAQPVPAQTLVFAQARTPPAMRS